MTDPINAGQRVAGGDFDITLTADVLVIGGGPAGIWAAIAAVQQGASVIVSEKGYVGTAGPFSQANTGIYYAKPDDPIQRETMVSARMPLAFGLADKRFGERVLDEAYVTLDSMAKWGFAWPRNDEGKEYRGSLRGPNVMIFLRRQLERLGVRILDHSPTLELLESDGVVAGAAGVNRQSGDTWAVRAGAVVIATGGTAFLSPASGCKGLTGDGYLLAAEAGAHFSGMEFTGQYHATPYGGNLTRGAYRSGAGTYTDNQGNEINAGRQMVKAILETGAAWDILDRAPDQETRELIRKAHAHAFLYFDRLGIDPFTQRHRVDFICEGSIRATGGIAIDDDLATTVPGLFAAGDVTSREKLNGAGPPGGGPAASWAFGAGSFAGRSAADFARRFGKSAASRKVKGLGTAGLRPTGKTVGGVTLAEVVAAIKEEMLPLDRNYWRSEANLVPALARFKTIWDALGGGFLAASSEDRRTASRNLLRAREAAGLVTGARLIYASALERKETRGLHRRSDYPNLDPNQTYHLISGGLDHIWVKPKPVHTVPEALAS
jgi:succinate dehydrogenase/fumarate reductase flavoprotein subunit